MKFLCVCEGGNVRSVALASILKMHGQQDAIAASARWNSVDTLTMLWQWADHVIVMAAEIFALLPPELSRQTKVSLVDVGPDVYGAAFHPALQGMLVPIVQSWQARQWDLHAPETERA